MMAAGMLIIHIPVTAEEDVTAAPEAVQEENVQNEAGPEENAAVNENENETALTAPQETTGQEESASLQEPAPASGESDGGNGEQPGSEQPDPAPAAEEAAPA